MATMIQGFNQDRIFGCPSYLHLEVKDLLSCVANPCSSINKRTYEERLCAVFTNKEIPKDIQDPFAELPEIIT